MYVSRFTILLATVLLAVAWSASEASSSSSLALENSSLGLPSLTSPKQAALDERSAELAVPGRWFGFDRGQQTNLGYKAYWALPSNTRIWVREVHGEGIVGLGTLTQSSFGGLTLCKVEFWYRVRDGARLFDMGKTAAKKACLSMEGAGMDGSIKTGSSANGNFLDVNIRVVYVTE